MRITGPEATALITALHAFKDTVEASFTHGERAVTLIEVLEFRELLGLPDFDRALFDGLAESVLAQDAIRFIESLVSDIEGRPTESRRFPREIGRGFLLAAEEPLASLVQMRRFYAGLDELLPRSEWVRPHPGIRLVMDLVAGDILDPQCGLICSPSAFTASLQYSITVEDSASELQFRIDCTIPRTDLHYFVHVILGFDDGYEKVSLEIATDTLSRTTNGIVAEATVTADDDGWCAELSIPRTRIRSREGVVIHSYCFVRPLDDDWNHFYDESLVSAVIPVKLPTPARDAT